MINDYLEIRNSEGMPKLVDSTIALNFLLTAKTGVWNCAAALTEAATPEVRAVMKEQLDSAIDLHERIYKLMMEKKWFHPYNLSEQFKMDAESSQAAVQIAGYSLFPGDTGRKGMFATLDK
jgi:spore coat protein CotF